MHSPQRFVVPVLLLLASLVLCTRDAFENAKENPEGADSEGVGIGKALDLKGPEHSVLKDPGQVIEVLQRTNKGRELCLDYSDVKDPADTPGVIATKCEKLDKDREPTQQWAMGKDGRIHAHSKNKELCLTRVNKAAEDQPYTGPDLTIEKCEDPDAHTRQAWERDEVGRIHSLDGSGMCISLATKDGQAAMQGTEDKDCGVVVTACDSGQAQTWMCERTCKNSGSRIDKTCSCNCPFPWGGTECLDCRRDCNNRGTVKKPYCTCVCEFPWDGDDCKICALECHNNGEKDLDKCVCNCETPWTGRECKKCSRVCVPGHGTLDETSCSCKCDTYWEGETCQMEKFVPEEEGHGVSVTPDDSHGTGDGEEQTNEDVQMLFRWLSNERRKCQPLPLPAFPHIEKNSLSIHKNAQDNMVKYKLRVLIQVTYVEAEFNVRLGSDLEIIRIDPKPCNTHSWANGWVQLPPDVQAAGRMQSIVDSGMNHLNARRRACQKMLFEDYKVEAAQAKVVEGVVYLAKIYLGKDLSVLMAAYTDKDGDVVKIETSPHECQIESMTDHLVIPTNSEELEEENTPTGNGEGDGTDGVPTVIEGPDGSMALLTIAESWARNPPKKSLRGGATGHSAALQQQGALTASTPALPAGLVLADLQLASTMRIDAPPESFDARVKFPTCFRDRKVRSAGYCGSSWAIEAARTFALRLCAKSEETTVVDLSPDHILRCSSRTTKAMGCDGGSLADAFDFISNNGVVEETCLPYFSENFVNQAPLMFNDDGIRRGSESLHDCPDSALQSCGQPYKGYEPVTVLEGEIEKMKKAIEEGAAIATNMAVTESFLTLRSQQEHEIYRGFGESIVGVESFTIVGWGQLPVEEGEEPDAKDQYWIITTSWGPNWANDGFAKVQLGINLNGIEAYPMWSDPHPSNLARKDDPALKGEGEGENGTAADVASSKNCPCSRCEPGYECGGVNGCPITMDWCRMTGDMALLQLGAYDTRPLQQQAGCPSQFAECLRM